MATSSIFASFDIKDEKTAESFVDAIEKSEFIAKEIITNPIKVITNPQDIKELWNKRKQKRG